MNWERKLEAWLKAFHDALLNIATLGIWGRIKDSKWVARFWKDDE